MAASTDPIALPQPFSRAVEELRHHSWRPELSVDEIPSPQRIAPHAVAIAADVVVGDDELGNGRLVILHDPAGNDSWQGTFRLVSLARAEVEPEMGQDPLLASVGWTWLLDSLEAHEAEVVAPSGTVTCVTSESFGEMDDEPGKAEIEIRASWTAVLDEGAGLSAHLDAWADLLCTAAGLPPLPSGVVMLPSRRP